MSDKDIVINDIDAGNTPHVRYVFRGWFVRKKPEN